MRYLVTGGAGFIGSHLVERLLAQGDEVVVLDNFDDFYDPAIKRANVQPFVSHDGFGLVEGDIRDSQAVTAAFQLGPYDALVHLAARAGVRPSIHAPALTFDVNCNGTVQLLEAVRKHDVSRVIFASSSSVYGNNEKVPFAETDPVEEQISPYAASKRAGELVAYTYHHLYGMNISVLRFFTVYGPRQRPEMGIHHFISSVRAGRPVVLFGDGTSSRDYTYIDDIVDGVVAALERCDGFSTYNLGNAHPVGLADLVAQIAETLAMEVKTESVPPQDGDVRTTFADISAARSELGYQPAVDLAEGLKRMVEWHLSAVDP